MQVAALSDSIWSNSAMCAIAGIYGSTAVANPRELIREMTDAMSHRGPDASGHYVDNAIALGHRRLSIIDRTDGGSQPKSCAEGRYTLVYNGEIYNFRELRQQLQAMGCKFKTESDTEVVLYAIIQWGIVKACNRFNGMFALAIWDKKEQTLQLARDRFGIKPLYWISNNGSIAFASEIKALLKHKDFLKSVSEQGLIEYLYYGNALGTNTLYKNCEKLKAGHYLTVGQNQPLKIASWWSLADIPASNITTEADAITEVREMLERAVKRHLIADVPVALLLSGGLDSSAICALASKAYSDQITTITVDFGAKSANSEIATAKLVSDTFGTRHEEHHLTYQNLSDVLLTMVDCHDQPFGDAANIPLYALTKNLADNAKVVLQGDGGDEMFGGYRRYRMLQKMQRWKLFANTLPVPRFLCKHSTSAKRLRRMQDALGKSTGGIQFAKLLTEEWEDGGLTSLLTDHTKQRMQSYDPFERYQQVFKQVAHLDAPQAMMWTDTQILLSDIFLEKVDRSTMANSVEVRVPFLDTELTDLVMGLPSQLKLQGNSKNLLRKAMSDVLPESITNGPKRGFGVPYGEWLAGPLADFTRDIVTKPNGLLNNIMDKKEINHLCDQHMKKGVNHGFMLYKMLMLAIWSDRYGIS